MSTLRVNNITDTSGGSSSLSVPGAAKAWVNFNGTGTVAIRAQLNVSSITDNAVGQFTVNFTTAMPDINYATFVSQGGDANPFNGDVNTNNRVEWVQTSSVRVGFGYNSGTVRWDSLFCFVSVNR